MSSTSAPPPTPSTQTAQNSNSNEAAAAEALSRLLHRLPPSLSLPSRRNANTTKLISPPSVSLSQPAPSLLSAAKLGFFQFTQHSIAPELASSAHSDSLSLFSLKPEEKNTALTQNWPFGYDANDEYEDEEDMSLSESFVLDSDCSTVSTELELVHLKEFTRALEKLGLEVVEALASSAGFQNPVKSDPSRVCSQMWISKSATSNNNDTIKGKEGCSGRFYPYVVGLHYQMTCQNYSMLADSGWVSVSPQVGSVLVTLGDIAEVWSNGKLKKVRGRPTPIVGDSNNNNVTGSHSITMSLLISLPVDSMVFPLRPTNLSNVVPNHNDDDEKSQEEEWVFNAFHFEDYAWRVYHERLIHKDPLLRYRV